MTCLIIDIADRPGWGVPNTCIYIDLDVLDPATLPDVPEITAITLAELHLDVASAKNPPSERHGPSCSPQRSSTSIPCRSTAKQPPGTRPWSR
jgi:hypothetical protein